MKFVFFIILYSLFYSVFIAFSQIISHQREVQLLPEFPAEFLWKQLEDVWAHVAVISAGWFWVLSGLQRWHELSSHDFNYNSRFHSFHLLHFNWHLNSSQCPQFMLTVETFSSVNTSTQDWYLKWHFVSSLNLLFDFFWSLSLKYKIKFMQLLRFHFMSF